MMPKFSVGSTVFIRQDLSMDARYAMQNQPKNDNGLNPVMLKYAGFQAKVVSIRQISRGKQYKIAVDGEQIVGLWTDEMFECDTVLSFDKKMISITEKERHNLIENYLFLLSLAKNTNDEEWTSDITVKLTFLTNKVKN